MLTASQAHRIALLWEFHTSSGEPDGCFYSFHPNDARPVSEEHRRQCLAYLELACIPLANADIDRGVKWHRHPNPRRVGCYSQRLCVGVRNLRQLYQFRNFLMVATLYVGH